MGSEYLAAGLFRRRLPRGAARRARPLGTHHRRQDREVSMRRTQHVERRPARCAGPTRPLRGLSGGHAGRQAGAAAGNPAYGAFLRSVHGLWSACDRCHQARTGAREGLMSAVPAEARPSLSLERLYVWQLPVRLVHWLLFFSILILTFTGYYIGNPFVSVPGPAGAHFV